MHVTMLGCPSPVGGANTEAGHTALLWRWAGIGVTIVPTWSIVPGNPWVKRLLDAGCEIVESAPDRLHEVPNLAGGVVASFCNQHACRAWPMLHAMDCRLVWSPCMTYLFPHERAAFRECPPTVLHFQSWYQRRQVTGWYSSVGCDGDRHYVIPGAADLEEFPFRPAERLRAFRVGRLARPDRTKWHRDTFPIVDAVRRRGIAARMHLMGWNLAVESKVGPRPKWATCFAPGCLPANEFLSGLHALLCINGGDAENWPRVGLEAMAAGVPIVAERRWGWLEMIRDGETGLLCDTPDDFSNALTRLAENDVLRLSLAENARQAVEEFTDRQRLAEQWLQLLWDLGG